MQVSVTGQKIDIGAALKDHVESTLIESVTKYFEQAVRADVVFSKSRYLFKADILVNEGTGTKVLVKANAEDGDVYAAFDQACDKIRKRLRRYKDRIKNHHKDAGKSAHTYSAKEYTLSSKEEDHNHDQEKQSPLIIAQEQSHLEMLSVSDAVMRMDLGELPALMFVNKETKHMNMIYRRADGHIAWIDSDGVGVTADNAA